MADVTPKDADLRKEMKKLVSTVDVDKITTKQFIALLSTKLGGVDLAKKKKFIKTNLGEIIDAMETNKTAQEGSDGDGVSGSDSGSATEEEFEEEGPPKKKAKAAGGTGRGGGGRGGLMEVKEISKTLADFLGQGQRMARTEVVKSLWAYIREHNLQNPEDKREIILDDAMREVFGINRFSMFQMNKYVGAHIYPFKQVDLTAKPSNGTKKPKQSKKRVADKKKKNGSEEKKKQANRSNTAFMAPFRLSPELTAVTGTDILPRPQVTKKLWEYIRKHQLQNPQDKRQIVCDQAFRKLMDGEKTVTMFTMNKFITKHLIEKVDPSLYKAENSDHVTAVVVKEDSAQKQESTDEVSADDVDSEDGSAKADGENNASGDDVESESEPSKKSSPVEESNEGSSEESSDLDNESGNDGDDNDDSS